ncbi:MAG: DUF2235 domain-containing protein, partial [Bdellovibrio bacteriovorus]
MSDGTGQHGGVGYESNIWGLYRALVQDDRQLCCYDDGVGSQELKLIRGLAGAFGWGLSRNVRELYTYLVRHWEPGDRIYLFGFSRGAFTVRLLAGLITRCGILDLSQIDSEAQLDRRVRAAYCALRCSRFEPQFTDRFRQRHSRQETGSNEPGRVPIHFVGVWDTVDAMGVPFDELREALDQVLRYSFRDRVLSGLVAHGCHAVALDDARRTFHPLLWDERIEPSPGRIEQVWFAGVHANVGGGYPKPQLAQVSLSWMIDRVAAFERSLGLGPGPGLRLQGPALAAIANGANVHGRLYDSRSGLGAVYRYAPRDTEAIRRGYTPVDLVVHDSAMERIAQVTDQYAPFNLTEHCPQVSKVLGSAAAPDAAMRWRQAMEHCWSIAWMRRMIYLVVALGVTALLLREGWGLLYDLGQVIGLRSAWLPGWLAEALASPWSRWIPLVVLVLALALRQRLRTWQSRLGNAGWAMVYPAHRPTGATVIRAANRSGLLALAASIRRSNGASLLADLLRGVLVRLLALVLWLPLRLGRWLHAAWCFRGLCRAELAEPLRLEVGDARRLVFETRDHDFATGIRVRAGERYAVEVVRWSGWADAQYEADPDGLLRPPPWLALARPLLRAWALPPFALLARVKGSAPTLIG